MLQVSTELPTLEKILDTFHNDSICIKVNNCGNRTVLEQETEMK
jgi:hypothetical protein